jgi:hypothetical protein
MATMLRPEGPCCRSGGLGVWAECWVVRPGGFTSPNVLVSLTEHTTIPHDTTTTSYRWSFLSFVHRIAPNTCVRPPVRFRFRSSVNTPPSCSNRSGAGGFPLVPEIDVPRSTLCTTLQHLPAGQPQAVKSALRNNRRTPPLTATVLCWRPAPGASETDRVK